MVKAAKSWQQQLRSYIEKGYALELCGRTIVAVRGHDRQLIVTAAYFKGAFSSESDQVSMMKDVLGFLQEKV